MGLSIPHLLVVLVIVVLVFGTKRLKNVGGDLGDAIKSFRKAIKEGEDAADSADKNNTTVIEGEARQKDHEQV